MCSRNDAKLMEGDKHEPVEDVGRSKHFNGRRIQGRFVPISEAVLIATACINPLMSRHIIFSAQTNFPGTEIRTRIIQINSRILRQNIIVQGPDNAFKRQITRYRRKATVLWQTTRTAKMTNRFIAVITADLSPLPSVSLLAFKVTTFLNLQFRRWSRSLFTLRLCKIIDSYVTLNDRSNRLINKLFLRKKGGNCV